MTQTLAWTRARPLGSLLAAAIALAALGRYGLSAAGLIAAFTCGVLVVLSVIDIESHRLPNRIVLPSAAIVLVARLASEPEHWQAWLLAGLGAFALFLVFALIAAVVPALLVGTLAGAAAGVVLLVRHGAKARRRALPFGPFLAFGAIAILLISAP
jgi:leader peptidase (prepilin peptidase)/N-methyltransferase